MKDLVTYINERINKSIISKSMLDETIDDFIKDNNITEVTDEIVEKFINVNWSGTDEIFGDIIERSYDNYQKLLINETLNDSHDHNALMYFIDKYWHNDIIGDFIDDESNSDTHKITVNLKHDITSEQKFNEIIHFMNYFVKFNKKINDKYTLILEPFKPSNKTDCYAGFTSNNGIDALTIYGRVRSNDTPASRAIILPKAITPDWINPAGMYVAKNLYRYNFKTHSIIGKALDNCKINCLTEKLYFDSYNDSTGGFDIGYKMEVLPMAWDPGFQKYSLCSLFLSLDVNWIQYTSPTSTNSVKYTCYQNFMPEIFDDFQTGTSANFSYRKSDCFTTSSYAEYVSGDPDLGISMSESVSCNFAYYISANNERIIIFTGH